MMLFGEKYPDVVRMVSIGDFSKELCGGTHLDNSGQVGLFKIVGEESVSAGTRRITALTGPAALEHVRQEEAVLAETAGLFRVPPGEVPHRVATLMKEVRELKKQRATAPQAGGITAEKLLADATQQQGVKIVVGEAPDADASVMRQLIDQLRKTASPVAVLLGSAVDGKVTLVAGLSHELVDRGVNAGKWIKGAAETVGGRGGGKPDMAQAGGKHADKLAERAGDGAEGYRGDAGGVSRADDAAWQNRRHQRTRLNRAPTGIADVPCRRNAAAVWCAGVGWHKRRRRWLRADRYSAGGGSYSKSFHFMGRRKGSMRSVTSPFWKMRTVPLDSLTATDTALVLRLMAAAAQCRAPRPLGSVMLSAGASM